MLAARTEGAATPALVRSDGPAPLTGREREIGSLAAAGLSSREVADRLFLSPRTVDNHLQRIFTKLGISRRSELASALHLQDSASEGIIE
jgi:DNA-binding CsgD family transcriptional regulator